MAKVNSERQAFLDALAADPADAATHAAFADWLYEQGEDDLARLHADWTLAKYEEALAYIDDFAGECDTTGGHILYIANGYLNHGEGLTVPFNTPEIAYDAGVFWRYFQTVTGRLVPEANREDVFVSCAC